MNKDELRYCEFVSSYGEKKQGYFHKWIERKNSFASGKDLCALLESEEGNVAIYVVVNSFSFIEKPKEEKEIKELSISEALNILSNYQGPANKKSEGVFTIIELMQGEEIIDTFKYRDKINCDFIEIHD